MQKICIKLLIHTGPISSDGQVPSALQRRTERHAKLNSLIYVLFLWQCSR